MRLARTEGSNPSLSAHRCEGFVGQALKSLSDKAFSFFMDIFILLALINSEKIKKIFGLPLSFLILSKRLSVS